MKSPRYRYAFFVVVLVGLTAAADQDDLDAVFSRISSEVQQNSQAYEKLGEATRTIGHRLTGSTNGEKAETYAYDLLKSYGIQDVAYQPFSVETWARDTVTLAIAPRKSDNFHDIPVVALAHSPLEANVSADLVDVGNGLEADFEANKDRLKGRIALANLGLLAAPSGAKNLHRSEKTALAIRYGASGIVMVNTVPGNVLLTGTASVTGSLIGIPAVCISLENGQQIREWMKEEKLMALVDMRNTSKKSTSRNVIATIKGKSRDKIVIGAHLDSWDLATGAIDNGLGSFAVIDIARTFQKLGLKPRRTIEFVLFMGEEQGLLGSKAYIRQNRKSLGRIKYMINLDMTNQPSGVNISGWNNMERFFQEVGNHMQSLDPNYKNVIMNRAGLHSDHQPFMLEGIPTLTPLGHLPPTIGMTYHTNLDTFDKVNKEGLRNTVRYTSMLLYALANAKELPTQRLSNEQTKDFLIKQGLKDELVLGNEWRW
ncbi:M20/M25/M40 family metallo-hydrolase [Siphonobacter sp. SORGH_AS_0500]|uniref:M20/M25/M40 family metallo-hydrolase n=1 Tax=Siphonobacter sp. SORGH_AS_0500 TaxID=1864824 RepID=UPI000CB9F122|nr:M20/M25/M40 family metallo-hydrolase [Siphonobacter sp. SORGH_AS_0500]MDR6193183.1 carboxypeptidase Q [Siphonobacter sp. SORGH_AS_0500]PKK36657.1 aminopeptidase [Siphonobacter sp. SORGH_AS_0500]